MGSWRLDVDLQTIPSKVQHKLMQGLCEVRLEDLRGGVSANTGSEI